MDQTLLGGAAIASLTHILSYNHDHPFLRIMAQPFNSHTPSNIDWLLSDDLISGHRPDNSPGIPS
jgi:hypothetical protein